MEQLGSAASDIVDEYNRQQYTLYTTVAVSLFTARLPLV